MTRFFRFLKDQKGFTLIELMAVGVILAILAVLAVPAVSSSINKARISAAKDSLAKMRDGVNRYQIDVGPTDPFSYPVDATTTESTFVSDLTKGTTTYFTTPATPNYTFKKYTGTATTYTVCIQAKDSNNTYLWVDNTGGANESTTAPAGALCS